MDDLLDDEIMPEPKIRKIARIEELRNIESEILIEIFEDVMSDFPHLSFRELSEMTKDRVRITVLKKYREIVLDKMSSPGHVWTTIHVNNPSLAETVYNEEKDGQ